MTHKGNLKLWLNYLNWYNTFIVLMEPT